ncbi:MAG: hypothetical protein Kow0025_00030 [Thermodesulfovibrionales bacterium]
MKGPALFVCLFIAIASCRGLLPTVKETTPSGWKDYAEAKEAFDKIVPYETTVGELKELGFDPFHTPNITILTYLDLSRSLGSRPIEEMDRGIRDCIRAEADCHAYEFEPKNIRKKRYGNFWLDFFNFRRKINETGWKFKALIIVVDGTVVYKLWGGNPLVNEDTDIRNPLGPLQDAGDMLIERSL